MRKIFNGKAYDTDTADMLAEWQSSGNYGASIRFETLYREKSGEYFLQINDPYRTGLSVKPLTKDEAKMWVMDCANDLYEEIFGEVKE